MAEIWAEVIRCVVERSCNLAAFWQERGTWLEFGPRTDDITSVLRDALVVHAQCDPTGHARAERSRSVNPNSQETML
jgi:hypothetical protein